MQSDIKFSDLKVISIIEQTHQETTTIQLVKLNNRLLVCKSMKKAYFDDNKKIEHLQNERIALEYFTNEDVRNINHMVGTFKDQEHVYFLLEPAYGLPLHKLMKMTEPFNPEFVSMIIAQIALILQDFHKRGFIYRDIKASNFVIDSFGKVTLIDLGKAKRINGERTMTLCGTTHAIPPEVMEGNGKYPYSYQFDYYGFGILIYELLIGKAPFGYQKTNPNLKQDIENGLMPQHLEAITDPVTADLITKLLNPPEYRLGKEKGFEQILSHPYFQRMNLNMIKQIMEGSDEFALNYNFKQYQSQIQDFGVEEGRYDDIQPDDPFYSF